MLDPLLGPELRGLRGPLTSDLRGYRVDEWSAGEGSIGESKARRSEGATDGGVLIMVFGAVGERGLCRGEVLYGFGCGSRTSSASKTSESGRGVSVGRRAPVNTGGCIYCLRGGRAVGVRTGAFLKGEEVGVVL
jgi:hypothetical protein